MEGFDGVPNLDAREANVRKDAAFKLVGHVGPLRLPRCDGPLFAGLLGFSPCQVLGVLGVPPEPLGHDERRDYRPRAEAGSREAALSSGEPAQPVSSAPSLCVDLLLLQQAAHGPVERVGARIATARVLVECHLDEGLEGAA